MNSFIDTFAKYVLSHKYVSSTIETGDRKINRLCSLSLRDSSSNKRVRHIKKKNYTNVIFMQMILFESRK